MQHLVACEWECAADVSDALAALDAHLSALWDAAPANTLFVVPSLGGNTAYTRWLQEVKCKRRAGAPGHGAWTPACETHFAGALEDAARGCLWLAVKH